jgi:hypothetical protein
MPATRSELRGSPSLGGAGPPILVYAGDHRGLIASLEREARASTRLAVAAGCFAGLLSATMAYLAYL